MIKLQNIIKEIAIKKLEADIEQYYNSLYIPPLNGSLADKKGIQITLNSYDKNIIQLSGIYIPKLYRSKGIGSEIMYKIIKYADDNNLIITLTPSKDFGASSIQRLMHFYSTFGFIRNIGRKKDYRFRDSMYRLPKND